MPRRDFTVTFPDGKAQTFTGPDTMTDEEVYGRAVQERAFAENRIPSTYGEGVRQSIGETIADKSGLIGTGVGLAGTLAGQPEVVAAAPLVGRGMQAIGEKVAGRPLSPVNTSDVAAMAVEGAVA